jgi:ribosomal protein S18 acetylase RimI-like enzyme
VTNLFTAKKLSVPGLLDDTALQEQLKQFGDSRSAEHKLAPPPAAATDMADRVAREYISAPSARAAREMPKSPVPRSPADRSPVERAIIGSPIGPLGPLGPGLLMAEQFGTLDAEERQVEADARAEAARDQETAFRNKAALRAQLRDMPSEDAARIGLPVPPAPITEGEKEVLRQQDDAIVGSAAAKTKDAEAAVKDPAKQPTQTWWLNAAQVGVRSAAEMGVSMAKLPPIIWEQYKAAITGSSEKSLPREWLDKVDTALTQMLPGDKARSKDFVTQLASGTGSMAAFMVAGYLGAAVGLPVGLSTGALGAATEGVQLYEEAEQFDATGLQKFLTLLAGAGLGVTEAIPIDRMFMRVDAANGGIVRRLLKTTAAGSLEEFIQETSQAVGEDVVAKYLYDEERKFDLKEYAQRGLVGAITGGIASGGVGAIAEIAGDSDVTTPTAEREAIVNTAVAELQNRFEALVGEAEGTAGVAAGVDIALPMPTAEFDTMLAPKDPAAPEIVELPSGTIEARLGGAVVELSETDGLIEIVDLRTSPAERGRGLASDLMRFVARRADAAGATTRLMALPDDDTDMRRLLRFYERYGFSETGEVDDGGIVMERQPAAGAAPAMATFRGGSIPTNEDGLVELTHWSDRPLDVIDPARRGTGPLVGEERRRLGAPGADPMVVDRSYYGAGVPPTDEDRAALKDALKAARKLPVRKYDAKTGQTVFPRDDAERAAFRKFSEEKGYVREGGLGEVRHTVYVDPNRLYNWYEDPLKLRAGLDKALSPSEQVTQYERAIRDAGFDGVFYSRSPLGQTAIMFTPEVPVEADELVDAMVAPAKQKELADQIPGLKGVLKALTPEERARVKAQTAQKLVDLFEQMPDPKEMAAVAVSGRAKRGWYARSAKALVDIFGLEDAPRFAALLAALSPQTSVENNAVNALNVWAGWLRAGRPTDRAAIIRIMGNSVMGGKGEASVLPAWIDNTVRALTTPDATTVVLSGPKVDSFMRNLQGVTVEVTNDAWMANYANLDQAIFKGVHVRQNGDKVAAKSVGYLAMSAAVRRAAEAASKLTGETWTPAEVQETVWSWAKTLYEKADAAGEKRTAEQILKAGGMTAKDIGATPDFATLFAGGVYRNILERAGYEPVDAGRDGGDGRDGSGGDVRSAEGTGFAQGTFERYLARAAQRLDALRARRATPPEGAEVAEDAFPGDTSARVGTFSLDETFGDYDFMLYEPVERADFDGELTPELFQRPGWAVVTAMKEALGSAETPENAALLAKMREELKGTDAIEISGMYKGVPQGASWIVFMPEDEALAMGRRYDQESILTNRGLVYGDGSVTPAVHDSTVVGEAAKREDFYSVLPGDRAFSMGLDFSTTIPAPEADAMATASRRGRYEGEQGRPGAGVPERPSTTPGVDGENDINLSRMSRNFVRLLNLTARQGRLTLKGSQIMGQYSRRSAVVRLRTWGDLSTLVHEGAHAFHDSMSPLLKAFVDRNANDFMDVGTQLYAGDLTYVPKDQHVREGFAEFFRVYTLNRQFVDNKYPRLTAEFTALLEAEAPQVKAGLDLLGAQFAAWLQLPSTQLLRNMVEPGIKATGINAAIKELRDVGFGTWYAEAVNQLVSTSLNRYDSMNRLVSGMLNAGETNQGRAIDLKRADDPRVLIRLARNTGGRAMVQLTDGVYAYRGLQPTTRSLRDALLISQGVDPTKSPRSLDQTRLQDFDTYLVALRSIDEYRRMQEGKIERPPVAATLGDVQQTARDLEAKYGTAFTEAATIVHEYGMALWKKQFDAGLMTKETYLDGLERRFYAPLQRDMSDKNNLSLGPGSLFGGRSIVKRFRGSDRNIISPMTTLMHKTFALERIIAQNDTLKAMALLSDRAGKAGAFVERVPSSVLTAKTFTVKEVARQLTKDDSLSETDAQDLMTLLEASIEDGSTIKLFRPEQASTYGENVLFYWEGGKLAAIQLKDGSIGADIVNMFNGLGRENMHVALEMIAMTSSAFRSAITAWPDFLLVNFIRDQMSAWVINDVGFKPFVTGLQGVGDELRQTQWSKMYNAAMGIMGGMNVATLHDARVARDLGALRGKGYIAKAFNDGGLPGAIKGMARVVELTETGTRLGIFRKAYERAKADGLSDWEAGIEASYTATDYIDFGLNGSRMLAARRTIPFLNAQLQGLYKMMRTLGADEVRQRKGLRFVLKAFFKDVRGLGLSRAEQQAVVTGRKAWVKMVSLGLLSAALHFLFEDDPDYQEAGEYLRTTGWVIPLGDGRIFYIPKPFELAIVANAVERGLESAAGDPEAKKRFLRGLAMTMTPPSAPPAIQTLVEYAANKDFFTGREIVPDYMQALQPQLQYNNYTSDLAKRIGEITGWSPMVLDHFMSGLGASAYRDMVAMTNALNPNRPSMDETDAPILRRFVRDVRRGSASAQDFWAQASMVSGRLRVAEVTYKNLIEGGNPVAANKFLADLPEDERAYALLNANFKAEAKRLNPFYRGRQITTIVSAMRRELASDLGLESTQPYGDPIKLTAREKAEIDEVLSEYARREIRNTLVATATPGWSGKKQIDAASTLALLEAVEPRVRAELARRLTKAKVYDASVVFEYWPEVKDRILRDKEAAFLDDIVTIAKVVKQ